VAQGQQAFFVLMGFGRRMMLAPPVLLVGCLPPFTSAIRSLTFLSAKAQRAPDVEIHVVPNRIAIGNGAQKQLTMVVKLQVDWKFLHTAREMLIEIFETKKHALPGDIYFVPSPGNGTMDHNTYYQHLRLHHAHVANLRSFAITNVSDIKAEITIYDLDGTNPRVMSFEQPLLSKSYGDTNKPLFYSVEPTQASTTEGRYLLVTSKNAIKVRKRLLIWPLRL
jgi:hypothetical protein